jgi:outer membrane protein OmpA-like peptidoglycan-associated protein/Tol biopolymer transport system component
MKRYFISAVFTACSLLATAQSGKLKKADNYYNRLAYAYAAGLYEELIASEVDTPVLKAKLATSYYKIGDMVNAEKYFAKMIDSPEATPENYFHYAQALKQNGNYAESDRWMQRFHSADASDMRGISFANNPTYVSQIEKQGDHFTVVNLAVNSATSDFGGYPSVDGKRVYFVSARRNRVMVQNEYTWNSRHFLDLYTSDKEVNGQLNNVRLTGSDVNTKYHEGPMCFSPDGKYVYYTRNNISKGKKRRDNQGIQNLKLYRAKVDAEGKWMDEEVLPFNSQSYSTGHPAISADGRTLYFVSDMPGGMGGADLYKVAIDENAVPGTPVNLGKEYNTEGQEMFPWIAGDGTLFFSSDGHIGLGGLDVFVMLTAKNGSHKLLNAGRPVNGNRDDFAFTTNADGRTGYFSSNRDGGKGDDDIYSYELIKPFETTLMLEGVVADAQTKAILPESKVFLRDEAGNILATTIADADGKYAFELEPDKRYVVSAMKDSYFDREERVSTISLPENAETIRRDVALEKDPGLALYALVTDGKTGKPLEGVSMVITDNMTGKVFLADKTPEAGSLLKGISDKKINDRVSYNITLKKEGYLGKTVTFNKQITQPGVMNVSEALDLTMDKLDVGVDLATVIDIKPIYFDYGKYAIRKDAATELDKIVKVMNEYPSMEIELGSHTDCRGTIASNEKLSDNRAKASAAYVKARISNPQRIYGKGYGESKLKNGCGCEGAVKSTCSEAEHQENRRTEFVIIKM